MTMVVAVPTMAVVMIAPDSNDHLGARCRNQRDEEHKGEKSKH